MAGLLSKTHFRYEFPRASARGLFYARSGIVLGRLIERHQWEFATTLLRCRVGRATSATAGTAGAFLVALHQSVNTATKRKRGNTNRHQREYNLPINIAHNAPSIACDFAIPRQRLTPSSHEHHTNLIRNKRPSVGQHRHIDKRKKRPSPTVRFAANDHQRRRTLRTQRKEHHHR